MQEIGLVERTLPTAGRNTGYQDALGVLVRMLQRGQLARPEVEEVITANCRREGRIVPSGPSMQRRVERLRATLERSGLALQPGPSTRLGRRPTSAPSSGLTSGQVTRMPAWPS